MFLQRRRERSETQANIARIERELEQLDREIELAAAPLPPKKDPNWKDGGGIVDLAQHLQRKRMVGAVEHRPTIERAMLDPGAKWFVEDANRVQFYYASACSSPVFLESPRSRVVLPPGIHA